MCRPADFPPYEAPSEGKADWPPAPANDVECWPFPCASYHETWPHRSGQDPCKCGCHWAEWGAELEATKQGKRR
jgi:hypothetical protein